MIRALLLPPTMAMLGRWNRWTPGWLQPRRSPASAPDLDRELEPAR